MYNSFTMSQISNIESVIQIIINKLKPLHPSKVILFGSYAYGTPSIDSDLDICIIKKEIKSASKERLEIRKCLNDIQIAKDILLSSEAEFEFYKTQSGSVFQDIDTKGRVLWIS